MHFNVKGNKFRYHYTVPYVPPVAGANSAGANAAVYMFIGTASGGGATDMAGDTWTINQNNALKSMPGSNVCD